MRSTTQVLEGKFSHKLHTDDVIITQLNRDRVLPIFLQPFQKAEYLFVFNIRILLTQTFRIIPETKDLYKEDLFRLFRFTIRNHTLKS